MSDATPASRLRAALTPERVRWIILGLVVLFGALTVGDYGVTIDEPVRAASGESWLRFFATGDHAYLPEGPYANYGALVDVAGALLVRAHHALGGTDAYAARHLLAFAIACLGYVGVHALGRRVLSPWGAVAALAMLVLVPRYYASGFTNPKDIPFAVGFIWGVYGIVRLLQEPSRRSAALCGLLCALATAARPFGAVLLPLGIAASLLPLAPSIERPWRLALITAAAGTAATIALWPMLWVQPPWHVVTAMAQLTESPGGTPELFFGKTFTPDDQPRLYVLGWLAVTVPLPTLLLALEGLRALAVKARTADRRRALWLAVLLGVWLFGPLVLPMVHHVRDYNGIRHFHFIEPAVCLVAAFGAQGLFERLARAGHRAAPLVVAALLYGDVLVTMVALHPYEDLYFSRFIAGMRGAVGSFDVPYYGETYRELFTWVATHAPAEGRPLHVATNYRGVPAYYADKLGMVLNEPPYDYYLTDVRLQRESQVRGETVYRIERLGVPLGVVVRVAP